MEWRNVAVGLIKIFITLDWRLKKLFNCTRELVALTNKTFLNLLNEKCSLSPENDFPLSRDLMEKMIIFEDAIYDKQFFIKLLSMMQNGDTYRLLEIFNTACTNGNVIFLQNFLSNNYFNLGKQRLAAALAALCRFTTYLTNVSFLFFLICCDATAWMLIVMQWREC